MTAAGRVTTDLATMQTASQHVFQVNEQIQAQLSSLIGRLEPLAAEWQSDASVSFQTLKAQWHDHAQKLNGALNEIGQALVANRTNYGSSDDESRQGFTGIGAVLG